MKREGRLVSNRCKRAEREGVSAAGATCPGTDKTLCNHIDGSPVTITPEGYCFEAQPDSVCDEPDTYVGNTQLGVNSNGLLDAAPEACPFLRHFSSNEKIVLPRLALDNHEECTETEGCFCRHALSSAACLLSAPRAHAPARTTSVAPGKAIRPRAETFAFLTSLKNLIARPARENHKERRVFAGATMGTGRLTGRPTVL